MSLLDEAAQHALAPGDLVTVVRFTDHLGVSQVYRYRYDERAASVEKRIAAEGIKVAATREPWDGAAPVSFLKGSAE